MNFIKNIFDNRIIQIILLPIAIYNLLQSYLLLRKEGSLVIEVINENEEFFKAMATMNFSPDDKIPYALSSTMQVDKIFTLEDIQSIAKETIIKTIMEFVKSEELLGIVLVKCLFTSNKEEVKIIIQPAHYQVYANDKTDVLQSIKIWVFLAIMTVITYKLSTMFL